MPTPKFSLLFLALFVACMGCDQLLPTEEPEKDMLPPIKPTVDEPVADPPQQVTPTPAAPVEPMAAEQPMLPAPDPAAVSRQTVMNAFTQAEILWAQSECKQLMQGRQTGMGFALVLTVNQNPFSGPVRFRVTDGKGNPLDLAPKQIGNQLGINEFVPGALMHQGRPYHVTIQMQLDGEWHDVSQPTRIAER